MLRRSPIPVRRATGTSLTALYSLLHPTRRPSTFSEVMHRKLLAPLFPLILLIGCGGTRQIPIPVDLSVVPECKDPAVGDPSCDHDSLLSSAAEGDSFSETDRYLDSLTVEVALPGDSTVAGLDPPDVSDSLAALTEARLPSTESLFDYPVVVNRRVLTWVDAYLGRLRKGFEISLRRSGRYLPMARRIFAEEGIPQDLAFLAHVESGFRPNARSRKSAYGLWQFIRGTARLNGLRCDGLVDERLDPERSARAAAQYLRSLHDIYGDWHLALAAYNAGPGKVNRAIKRSGYSSFWEIANTRYLRRETRNFVPAILATTILSKSPSAYGLTEETEPPLVNDTLTVHCATDLRVIADAVGLAHSDVIDLNPSLLYGQTPPKCSYMVRLPVGTRETAQTELAKIPPKERLIFHRHRVRSGDTLSELARHYGTTVRAIQAENGLGRSTLIRVGKTLRIPTRPVRSGGKSRSQAKRPEPAQVTLATNEPAMPERCDHDLGRGPSTAHVVEEARTALAEAKARGEIRDLCVHVVRRGDTLSAIARRYDVPLSRLYRLNNLGPRSIIRPGQEIITERP